jgi:hypothetical protein
MPKGFGQPQPTKTDKLVEQVLRHATKRNPESLDRIFDNLPVKLNEQVLFGTIAALAKDTDTLAWLCGYFAGEINSISDNDKPYHRIILLSKLLMKFGMEPFKDFTPTTGCRISVIDVDKFEALPAIVREVVEAGFDSGETSDEDFKRINEALLAEMVVG